jgi:hypothetical protein
MPEAFAMDLPRGLWSRNSQHIVFCLKSHGQAVGPSFLGSVAGTQCLPPVGAELPVLTDSYQAFVSCWLLPAGPGFDPAATEAAKEATVSPCLVSAMF